MFWSLYIGITDLFPHRFSIDCMANSVLSPLFEYFNRIPLKGVGDVFRFAAHQTGKDKSVFGKKPLVQK